MNYTPSPVPFRTRRQKKSPKKLIILFLLVIIGLSIYFGRNFLIKKAAEEVKIIGKLAKQILEPKITHSPQLKQVIDNILKDSQGKYAVAIKNLETNESYYLNEHEKLQTASLYKVWVMATTYKKIKEGTLKEDEVMKQDIAELNQEFNLASDEADLAEGTLDTNVNEALEKMITISDNYSALLLTKKVGVSAISNFLSTNDFKESNVGQPPQTSAYDMSQFFEKLYDGDLTDEVYTKKMTDLLKRQKINNVLPVYIPKDVSIAHKTGELYTYAHDAGIVYTKDGDYVIVVMSQSYDVPGAEDRMAKISETVFKYFTDSSKGN